MHDEKILGLQCRDCGALISEKDFALSCGKCGAPLRLKFSPDYLRQELAKGFPAPDSRSFLREWARFLPIDDPGVIDTISLGEVETRLLPSLRLGRSLDVPALHFKLEIGPTLSLKDRGTALCVLKAVEMGRNTLCLSSSGNNAASIAAYGARAGLRSVVFVQRDVSPAKMAKCQVYGGHVVVVDGDMAAASALCAEMVSSRGWFQCGGPNPYRVAGKRMFAYGIVRQLGRAPDTVLIPCGGGAGMVAAWDGFSELYEAGVIKTMPRLVGVQLEACNPTATAFAQGKETVTPVVKKPSLSDAIMNNNPCWGTYCLQAVRQTGGTFISVSDAEFIKAIKDLAAMEGIYAEPAGAVSVAALAKLRAAGFGDPGLTVCNITGHGLNFPQATAGDFAIPAPIPATVEAVEAFLGA